MKKSKPIMLSCPHCAGSGHVQLAPAYQATLDLLRGLTGTHNGAELGRIVGIKETAMNNRLIALERYGLVQRTIQGRACLWAIKSP